MDNNAESLELTIDKTTDHKTFILNLPVGSGTRFTNDNVTSITRINTTPLLVQFGTRGVNGNQRTVAEVLGYVLNSGISQDKTKIYVRYTPKIPPGSLDYMRAMIFDPESNNNPLPIDDIVEHDFPRNPITDRRVASYSC